MTTESPAKKSEVNSEVAARRIALSTAAYDLLSKEVDTIRRKGKALEKFLSGKATIEKKIQMEENGETVYKIENYPITHKCIEHLICNPFYYGARRQKGKAIFTGKEKHTPLISKELFDACQKIKAIRAQHTRVQLALEIQKPFMNLMKCGACGHFVTGEVHKKSSGKIYVYYHCANQSCHERRLNVRQEEILKQLVVAFEPFARLTPKATAAFLGKAKEQVGNIGLCSLERQQELEAKKKSIELRCDELRGMVAKGNLNETEFEEIFTQKRRLIREIEIEIEAHIRTSEKTLSAGLKVIELLGKSHQFMALDGNELNKAILARTVLSNPTLKAGKLEYHYKKPFDDLVLLTGHRNWWTRTGSNR